MDRSVERCCHRRPSLLKDGGEREDKAGAAIARATAARKEHDRLVAALAAKEASAAERETAAAHKEAAAEATLLAAGQWERTAGEREAQMGQRAKELETAMLATENAGREVHRELELARSALESLAQADEALTEALPVLLTMLVTLFDSQTTSKLSIDELMTLRKLLGALLAGVREARRADGHLGALLNLSRGRRHRDGQAKAFDRRVDRAGRVMRRVAHGQRPHLIGREDVVVLGPNGDGTVGLPTREVEHMT